MKNTAKRSKASQAEFEHTDALLDEALRGTFPSSDPIAVSVKNVSHPAADEIAPGADPAGDKIDRKPSKP
jgi:hypothetical protein